MKCYNLELLTLEARQNINRFELTNDIQAFKKARSAIQKIHEELGLRSEEILQEFEL